MKVIALVLLLVATPAVVAEESNPLGKVFELMSALQTKIVKEGEAEAKAFKEFFEWCDSSSQNLNNDKNRQCKPRKIDCQDWRAHKCNCSRYFEN
jgi:hypothetical protein